ncbi:diaminopimelate epimerase [Pseudohoeflea coraliihabitans]|uniref:Diaminopimelate epimerase n=1 Tax=Pseudohoeflea coraliihabitans TaxID=2860393 RepID=A0ABS6WL94_9HYPH|nr:diaminopimelate epimerase [Pseudohoeflea sp. DP4N28-3]MBW3096724.1 diaminopimelate epimerase [Pseudohoeflea sp. DP4N28-3]
MNTCVAFARMNGLGNEILVVDMRGRDGSVAPAAARALAADPATRFDQIMAVHDARSDESDYRIEILNSDGSEAEACGNGTRCVVQALAAETGRKSFSFDTRAGRVSALELEDGRISVDMGIPAFRWDQIPLSEEFADTRAIELQAGPIDAPILHSPSVVSMGNPHAIFWVDKDIWDYDLARLGPMLEQHPIFPNRANITIARPRDANTIEIRTWERGAGLTRACGSAACAVAVSAARTGRAGRSSTIIVPGGPLALEWRDDDHVIMTGPAEWEWAGRLDPSSGDWQRLEEPV